MFAITRQDHVQPSNISSAPHQSEGTTVAQYTTSQEAMAQGAAKVDEAANQIQGHINNLRTEVETMMGGWRGEAASAFVQVHDSFEQQAARINNALRQMQEALVSTHRTYGTQESTQTQTLSGLAGQINA
jgi:WXG100 family type VII secretion target